MGIRTERASLGSFRTPPSPFPFSPLECHVTQLKNGVFSESYSSSSVVFA